MKHLPVSGYTDQELSKVEIVNQNKIMEEMVLRQIDHLKTLQDTDGRMAAIAHTKMQEAFMWLNRAIFKPSRLFEPEHDRVIGEMMKSMSPEGSK